MRSSKRHLDRSRCRLQCLRKLHKIVRKEGLPQIQGSNVRTTAGPNPKSLKQEPDISEIPMNRPAPPCLLSTVSHQGMKRDGCVYLRKPVSTTQALQTKLIEYVLLEALDRLEEGLARMS